MPGTLSTAQEVCCRDHEDQRAKDHRPDLQLRYHMSCITTACYPVPAGKMVCTGAKSEEDSRLAARKYARIVQKLGFQTKFKDFKIQNMVRGGIVLT